MINRPFWAAQIDSAWQVKSVVWLTGVRRVGKTTLAAALPEAEFLNCDLPSTARLLGDPERFYRSVQRPVIVFDEIHQLADPSRILKIGADAFPQVKILATGCSTLAATKKFRDSLTGRKRSVHLLPVLHQELGTFGISDLQTRLFHGGLPEPLLLARKDPGFFAEWLDSYYARDVQELFRVAKRQEFLRLVELVLRQSSGLLEVSSLAKHTNLSRPTVQSYLEYMQLTHLVYVLRPYHRGGRQEILRQPKIYGFDTGFVSFCRGWDSVRDDEYGLLWEHVVLDTLRSHDSTRSIYFWRDKLKREVDFVVPVSRGRADAIECKWDADRWSPRGLRACRDRYPEGSNFVVSPHVVRPYERTVEGLEVTVCDLAHLDGVRRDLEGW